MSSFQAFWNEGELDLLRSFNSSLFCRAVGSPCFVLLAMTDIQVS